MKSPKYSTISHCTEQIANTIQKIHYIPFFIYHTRIILLEILKNSHGILKANYVKLGQT